MLVFHPNSGPFFPSEPWNFSQQWNSVSRSALWETHVAGNFSFCRLVKLKIVSAYLQISFCHWLFHWWWPLTPTESLHTLRFDTKVSCCCLSSSGRNIGSTGIEQAPVATSSFNIMSLTPIQISHQSCVRASILTITITDRVVHMWGTVGSLSQKNLWLPVMQSRLPGSEALWPHWNILTSRGSIQLQTQPSVLAVSRLNSDRFTHRSYLHWQKYHLQLITDVAKAQTRAGIFTQW